MGSLIAHVQYSSANDIFTFCDALQEIQTNVLPELPNASVVTISIFPDSGADIFLAEPKQTALKQLKMSVVQNLYAKDGSQLDLR